MFGVLQGKKMEITPQWKQNLEIVCESIEKGVRPDEVLRTGQLEMTRNRSSRSYGENSGKTPRNGERNVNG
jgi:hypothetical protein